MEGRQISVGTTGLAALEWGDPTGPLAVLLHGFPDTPHTWDSVAPEVAAAGYRVVAPWLRGYFPSPPASNCQAGAYVQDVVDLHEQLGGDERSVIVGHDIGAAIAYGTATYQPDRWARIVTVSLPPMNVLAAAMASYPQLRRSWYVFFFQSPMAEGLILQGGHSFFADLLREWSPGFDPSPRLDQIRQALPDLDHLTSALGWYRAGLRPDLDDPGLAVQQASVSGVPPQPWLYLHGLQDGCVGPEVAKEVPGVVLLDGAGHFPHEERAESFLVHLRDSLSTGKRDVQR